MEQVMEACMKQELAYETEILETNNPDLAACEQDNESGTVRMEVRLNNSGKKKKFNKNSFTKNNTRSTIIASPDDSFLYCNECKLKCEGDCPEHGPIIYVDNAELGKHGHSCIEEFSTQTQVVWNACSQISGRGIVVQPVISGKDEEIYFQNQFHFFKQEYVQASEKMVHGDKYLEVGEHEELSSVFPECRNINNLVNGMINKAIGTSVVEMTRDKQMESRKSKTLAPLNSAVYHERTEGMCDTQNDCKQTLQNEDCRQESNNIFPLCEKNDKLSAYDIDYRLQSDIQTQNLQKQNAGEKMFKCDVCGIGFAYTTDLKAHVKIHTENKSYECDVEFSQCGNPEIQKRPPTRNQVHKCDVCGAGFVVKCSRLKIHKRIHSGQMPFTCDVCSVHFTQYRGLVIHKRTHTGEKPYKCAVCGVGFTQCNSLNIHKITHTGKKPYKCDVCGAGFSQCCNLERHKITHTGEKPYKCDVCGVGFSQSCNLERHKITHTGEKPYKCNVCDVGFARFSTLETHKRTHTGEKPYSCDVCGVGFSHSCNLESHKRTHTGEKPYKCDVCNVRFADHTSIETHKRTHTGEKPYICDVCGVEFAQRSTLKRHKRVHTGEKPYNCDICSIGFNRNYNLQRHKRKHENRQQSGN